MQQIKIKETLAREVNVQRNLVSNTVIPVKAGIPLSTSSILAKPDASLRWHDGLVAGAFA